VSISDVLWTAGTPARGALLLGVRLYRATLAGWLGGQCRFYPTCSHYAETAIREHGAVRGTIMAGWRIARCNPYSAGGVDHVPPGRRARSHGRPYEAILQLPEGTRH
jgi:putative membrane protein insertion efficiency factor